MGACDRSEGMVTNYWASNRSEVYGSQSKGASIRSENIYGANSRSEHEGAAACKKSRSHTVRRVEMLLTRGHRFGRSEIN
jgi:hypothetical protein